MLKKEIWAIKRLGFPSLRVMISVSRVQGLGFEHRAFALFNGDAKETVQPFALSFETQQAEKKSKHCYTTEAIVLLSEQKADTRQEEGSLSNVKHAHFE